MTDFTNDVADAINDVIETYRAKGASLDEILCALELATYALKEEQEDD